MHHLIIAFESTAKRDQFLDELLDLWPLTNPKCLYELGAGRRTMITLRRITGECGEPGNLEQLILYVEQLPPESQEPKPKTEKRKDRK